MQMILDDNLKLQAKKVVDALKLPGKFDSTQISNPALQKHYSIVQAIALDEPMPETAEDQLQPDTDGIIKHKHLFDQFNDESKLFIDQIGENSTGNKRKSEQENGEENKKVKTELNAAEYEKFDWPKEISSGRIKKLTIPELKIYLRKYNLTLAGKKEELINRIINHHTPI